MPEKTRRQFLFASVGTLGAVCATTRGCESGPVTINGFAIIAVKIGERLVTLSHPAARVAGVILMVSGTLIVTSLEWGTYDKKTDHIKVSQTEVDRLIGENRIALQRKDGKFESAEIDEVKYQETATNNGTNDR